MEETLNEISQEPIAARFKSLRESCLKACGHLYDRASDAMKLEPWQLREACLIPFKIALESRSMKLASLAVTGLQRLISDDRFCSNSADENPGDQLPVQFLKTIAATPSLADEIQVEIMKLLLLISCSASCEVHGDHLISVAEICIETFARAHQGSTKATCRATLSQLMTFVGLRLQDNGSKANDSYGKRPSSLASITSEILTNDVILLLKHFSFRLQSTNWSNQQSAVVLLYVESMHVILCNLPAMVVHAQHKFVDVIADIMCPALVYALNNPAADPAKRGRGANMNFSDESISSSRSGMKSTIGYPLVKWVHFIAVELLRLVGLSASLRPSLKTLFHRILLHPPPQHRLEALRITKEVLGNPQRLLSLAGPLQDGSVTTNGQAEGVGQLQDGATLDLFRLIMDGVRESCHYPDAAVCSASVACAVALLGNLEDMSNGHGLTLDDVAMLGAFNGSPHWPEIDDPILQEQEDSSTLLNSHSSPNIIRGPLEDSSDECDPGERGRARPKHIRWKMDFEGEDRTLTDASDDHFLMSAPKTVRWAAEHKEHIIETRQGQLELRPPPPRGKHRAAMQRRSAIPRSIGKPPVYQTVRSRTDSGLKMSNKSTPDGNSDDDGSENIRRSNALFRCRSAIEIHSKATGLNPDAKRGLRRTRSSSDVNNMTYSYKHTDVSVDHDYFNEARKQSARQSKLGRKLRGFAFDDLKGRNENGRNIRRTSNDDHDSSISSNDAKESKHRQPRPILRRVRSFSEYDRQRPTHLDTGPKKGLDIEPFSSNPSTANNSKAGRISTADVSQGGNRATTKQGSVINANNNHGNTNPISSNGIISTQNSHPMDGNVVNGNSGSLVGRMKGDRSTTRLPRKISKQKQSRNDDLKSPNKETTINGIPLSKIPRQGTRSSTKARSLSKLNEDERETVEETERDGARNFARCLLGILPSVLAMTETRAVDESIQQFASDICEAVSCMALKRKHVPNFGTLRRYHEHGDDIESGEPVLNADCVYLTVYATLGTNYQLNSLGYYHEKVKPIPITEDQFLGVIDSFGVEIGLSRVWLLEMYRLVTTYDILAKAGFRDDNPETNRALIKLLTSSLFPLKSRDENKTNADAMPISKRLGASFAHSILLTAWDSVLEILGVPLDTSTKIIAGNGSIGLALMLGTDNRHDHVMRERDMICLSLDGLRRAARICCTLGIQSRCEVVLSRLAEASCTDSLVDPRPRVMHPSVPIRLHAAHVLSMDALLAAGLELGSLVPKCWKHVFRCCFFISHLQNCQFQAMDSSSQSLKPSRRGPHGDASDMSPTASETSGFSEAHSFDGSEASRDSRSLTVNGMLSPDDACRAVYALASAVENLFATAATTLPLPSLIAFITELVEASRLQLVERNANQRLIGSGRVTAGQGLLTTDNTASHVTNVNTMHVYHICDIVLRCARNAERPLLHVMGAWCTVSQHLTEVSCCRSRHVSKIALTSIHDIVSELLRRRNELLHFWFHELLFKPFDDLMALELCEAETQDQILYTLYELVEGFASQIKSGWRTLLGSLRSTQIFHRHVLADVDDSDQRQLLVFRIVEHFISSKNTSVFASAAVECILCLLRFVRGGKTYADHEESNDDTHSDDDEDGSVGSSENAGRHDLCQPALTYLCQVSKRLSTIYIQPSTFIFNGSYNIFLVDPSISHGVYHDDTCSSTTSGSGSDVASRSSYVTAAKSICAIDDTGILRVWFLLIEGLTNSVSSCPHKFQSQAIDSLFDILKTVATVPGPHFALFAVTHLLLPMLQSWVRRGAQSVTFWHNTLHNFKHACGLATQLVVEEIGRFMSVEGASDCVPAMMAMLLDLYVDCVSQPHEAIARLGCSCLRHLLLSAGPHFSEGLWQIVCKGIGRAFDATLAGIKDLIHCYPPGSTSVSGGDNGLSVKVVARRDALAADSFRLQQMAEQVFLLENQIPLLGSEKEGGRHYEDDDHRLYIFILTSSNGTSADDQTTRRNDLMSYRISFKTIVIGLLANQILLHMLGSMLLENSDQPPSHSSTGLMAVAESGLVQRNPDDESENPLPGLLSHLSPANLALLFGCLRETHEIAHCFNTRPGLRYLIQRLSHLPSAANLLRQSITAFAYYLNTLFHISRHDGENVSISHIKRYLSNGDKTTEATAPDQTSKMAAGKEDRSTQQLADAKNKADLLKGDRSVEWMVRRLFDACNQLSDIYSQLHAAECLDQDSGIDMVNASTSSTPSTSPYRTASTKGHVSSSEESLDSLRLGKVLERNSKNTSFDWFGRRFDDSRHVEMDTSYHGSKTPHQPRPSTVASRRLNDDDIHLNAWTHLVATMLESLLALPTLQFKTVLPAVFPSVTSLITTIQDHRVRQLVCDVVRRCGTIYGIV